MVPPMSDPFSAVADVLDRLDVDATWRRAKAVLEEVVDPTDEQAVRRAIERAAREAHHAYLLALKAKRETEREEEEVAHALGSLRSTALDHLTAKVKAGNLGGNRVTNDLIDYTAREQAPEQWEKLRARKARAEQVREALVGLHDKLMESSRNLRALNGPTEGERTNRGASR